jgi:hypothetical protein
LDADVKLIQEKISSKESKHGNIKLYRVVGESNDSKLIEAIDQLIGENPYSYSTHDGKVTSFSHIDETETTHSYREKCSDMCADYVYGTGCGWYVHIDKIAEFKSLFKSARSKVGV